MNTEAKQLKQNKIAKHALREGRGPEVQCKINAQKMICETSLIGQLKVRKCAKNLHASRE